MMQYPFIFHYMLTYTGFVLRRHSAEVMCQSLFHLHLRQQQRTELLKGLLNLQEMQLLS